MAYDFVLEGIRARPSEPIMLDRPVSVTELPTPALVLERGALMRNIQQMADHVGRHGKGFRPHAKTHKCPVIARLQLEAGAVGICVAKVSEACALTAAGVGPLLITSPVSSPVKARYVAELALEATGLSVVVDSRQGLDVLIAALDANARLNVLIDLDVAMGRTGTRDDDLVEHLVTRIDQSAGLTFVGFQHYAGHVMHIAGHGPRRAASLELWSAVQTRLAALSERGIVPQVVTGCGTGTYDIDTAVPEITDLQVGSYIFMDEEYRAIGGSGSERFTDFEVSLTVACTAISQPMAGAMTLDGGYKAMASDTCPAAVDELPNTKFRFAGDEHGVLLSRESLQAVRLGDVVRLVTPHCDPTVNLHDLYWVLEDDGQVHECWPVTARGCTW